jgi:outer membrane scaffolding protein for murein synthesis (MipA/OmpV family)
MNNLPVKKSLISPLSLAALIIVGSSVSGACVANDITYDVRNKVSKLENTENYFEIGVMHTVRDESTFSSKKGRHSNTSLFINGNYHWNDLFIESYSENGHGAVVGYNAFKNDDWSFDLIATTDWWKHSFEHNGRYSNDTSVFTVGGRLSGYLGDNMLQFTVNQDATGDHNGTTVSALIGRNWQYENWNLHGLFGAEYASAKINDYYVGISEEQAASTRFDAYEAGASLSFSGEVGATYTFAEDWEFRATVRAATRDDELINSPKFKHMDNLATSVRTSISYVF